MSESLVSAPEQMSSAPRRVLSGMRPTGKLHLGNYMGALHNWVRLQHEYECFFFVADIHALTTDYADPSQIKQNTIDVALDFLAAGLDPEKCTIFVQSHVKQHAELHLLLSMITPLSWLERVPTYKEQLENLRVKDLATYGFLGYPLLQSADILLYRPKYVPVGQDQVSHVELTREVARRFNSIYKSTILPEPDVLLTPTPKLPGLDGRKMSKSYGNTIGLTEHPARIVHKMQSMTTNGQRPQQSDPGNPDLCPVGDMHKVFSGPELLERVLSGCRTAAIRCEWCKQWAGQSITKITEPIYKKRQELENNIDQTWAMLRAQAEKAAAFAEETMLPVRAALNITQDLGSARRHFGYTAEDKEKQRELRATGILSLERPQRDKELRQYWRTNIIPYDIPLSQEANRKFASIEREIAEPFLTAKKKRVFVGAPQYAFPRDWWFFLIPAKSYEVWILLTWDENDQLSDFVVPQKFFSHSLAAWKRGVEQNSSIAAERREDFSKFLPGFFESGDASMPTHLRRIDERFLLSIGIAADPIDITDLCSNYEPLK